jgi:hypothetical protein
MNWTKEELLEVLKNNSALKIRKGDLNLLPDEPKVVILKPSVKGGWREDLDKYFRSSWEANYARYLNYIKEPWEYEPKEFEFPIKRGNRTYKPDFWLPKKQNWIEIKGYMDQKSKTKLNRFKKYYPEEFEKLIIITEQEYKEIAKYKGLIPYWEG